MTPSTAFILDTNILVHFVRQKRVWERIRAEYSLLMVEPTPIISIVSVGEIRSLAVQWNWEQTNLDQMEFALSFFPTIPITDQSLVRVYATLDASLRTGNKKVRMGKNDLWIAATAVSMGRRLITSDKDFDPLVPTFLQRDWIDPAIP